MNTKTRNNNRHQPSRRDEILGKLFMCSIVAVIVIFDVLASIYAN